MKLSQLGDSILLEVRRLPEVKFPMISSEGLGETHSTNAC